MSKKLLTASISLLFFSAFGIFTTPVLAAEVEIYPGSGNATANATSDGWTDNHMVGQTFIVPAGVSKITRVRLTNFKLGYGNVAGGGANLGGIVSVALFPGVPGVTKGTVPDYNKDTTFITPAGAAIAKVERIYIGDQVPNQFNDLCGWNGRSYPDNSILTYLLKKMRINDPNKPCPKKSELVKMWNMFFARRGNDPNSPNWQPWQNLIVEWIQGRDYDCGGKTCTIDGWWDPNQLPDDYGGSDFLWDMNREAGYYGSGATHLEGSGWSTQSVSWQGTDSADNYIDVNLSNNIVAPGQTYFISIQQSHRDTDPKTWDEGGFYEQGRYNCEGPNEPGPVSVSSYMNEGKMCGKGNVFVVGIDNNNPYTSGQSYFNTYYYPGGAGDVANLTIWGQTIINNAACSSIAAPATVNSGQTFAASVQMLNTGTTTWTSGSSYRLGSQTPLDNTTWGSNRANLSAEPVAPNTVGAFNFNVAAPSTPGVYDFDWQMVQDGGTPGGWFGDTCRKRVTVVANPVGNFDGGVCTALTGWTCDGDNYNAALRVDFYADGPAGQGTPLTSVQQANLPGSNSQDAAAIAAQCGGTSNHRFSYAIPANALRDGRSHQIYAYGINIGTGTHTLLPGSPKPVSCAAPQLKALQITRGTSANRTAGTYGVSGLNTTQGGSGYYNSLQIAQSLENATDDNVALVGIAFTQSSGSPGAGANLQQLMDHVRTTNGFMLLSVNKTRTINGQTLTRGNYYVYYRNSTQWQPLRVDISGVLSAAVGRDSTLIKPVFDVELYSGLGSRTWGTYGYLMDTNNRESSAPQPASPTLP